MKRFFIIVLFVSIFITENVAAAVVQPQLQSNAAVLMEQSTGKVLFDKNSNNRMYPASTTKILTALIALENLNLKDTVVVGDELKLVSGDSSEAGLHVGDKLSVKDLMYALMLPSGDDAAYTIAVYTARKKSGNSSMSVKDAVAYFVEMMNKKAREIGAKNSNFADPDGYPNDKHYSTAHDIAIIAREALKNAFFREVVKTYTYKAQNIKRALQWNNSNQLINPKSKYYYPPCMGIKTGHTFKAGFCLASIALNDDMSVISVTLESNIDEARWTDSKALLKYGLDNFKIFNPLKRGQYLCSVEVSKKYSNVLDYIKVVPDKDYKDVLPIEDINNVKQEFKWNEKLLNNATESKYAESLHGPISKGQVIGNVTYTLNGKTLFKSNLLSAENVNENPLEDILMLVKSEIFTPIGAICAGAAAAVILGLTGIIIYIKKKK